jgi:sulfate permease, SulP family
MRIPRTRSISFAPFMEEIRGYKASFLRDDLFAALAVALMTIPQSIAYSLLAGLPPTAGLFSAIFGTIFTASLGSSRTLVSGPSTGTAILLQTSLADVLYSYYENVTGPQQEALVLMILMQIVLVIGLIQIGAAFFNVSKLLQFVSRPVVLGYFGGITVAIAITQVFSFTGISSPASDEPLVMQAGAFFMQLPELKWTTFLVGIVSLALLVVMRYYFKNWPHALIMLIVGSLLAESLNYWGIAEPVKMLGNLQLPQDPFPEMTFPILHLKILNKIFPAAVAIAFLGILEVFSLSRTFGSKSGQIIQINQDVFGLGVSNVVLSSVVGGMPSSGSATRTALNYRLHAKSRFAAIFSGLITGAVLVFLWPLVAHIPLAALAALLIASVHTLMDWKEIQLIFRATAQDASVFLLTFISCLFFSLDVAFFIGIVISIATYLKKSSTPHLVEYAFNSKGRLVVVNTRDEVHRKVRIIGIGGELYFAATDVFQSAMQDVSDDPHVQAIVLRLNNVHHMDASMCLAILHLYEQLKLTNRYLVISGLTEEVWHVFHRAGVVKEIGFDNLYFTDESNPQFSTWKAALRAQDLIHNKN